MVEGVWETEKTGKGGRQQFQNDKMQERNYLSGEGAMQRKVLKLARKSENRVWETGDSSLPVCLPYIDRHKVTNTYSSIRFV